MFEATRWLIPVFRPDKQSSYAIVFREQFLARADLFSANVPGGPTAIGEPCLNFGIV